MDSFDHANRDDSLRQVIDALPQLVWRSSPDGSVDTVNSRWEAFTGRRTEDLLRDGWLDCVHPEDLERFTEQLRGARTNGTDVRAELRMRRLDGEYAWVEATCAPIRGKDGAILWWLGVFEDVHSIRETQRELRGERDRFAQLVASAPGAIYAYRLGRDGKTTYPFVSAGIKDLYGLSAEELAIDARPTVPFINSKDMGRMWEAIKYSAKHLTPFRFEWRVNHPQKGELWVEGRAVPRREPDRSTLWYGIIVDITERKHAEELLRVSQARLQAAISAGGIGTWVWDVAHDALWWDEMMLKIWGRTAAEVNGKSNDLAMSFIHPEDRSAVAANIAAFSSSGEPSFVNEFRILRADGALQWITVHGTIERDNEGRMIRVIGACMDITSRKRDEDTQRRSQRLEALGTLAGGIAHDFNNILLAITGNTRLAIADMEPDHPSQISLAEISKASARATNLVQRILAFSRQSEPKRELMQLQPTVEEALKLLRSTLPAMINIETSFASDMPAISGDSTQIHQIMMNLLTNSAHSIGDQGGAVTVSIDSVHIADGDLSRTTALTRGRYVRLTVSDTGAGMSPETMEHIFDPFFTTKPVGQGTGLGLSVVHGIMRSHQGAITVHSSLGEGATFRLYFPATGHTEAKRTDERKEASRGRGQRIMYVDDEDALVYLVTRKLQRLGYTVMGFTDPAAALSAFQADPRRFDVVVTDLSMPGMSGFHLAKSILETRPGVPVLMTSGYVRTQDRERALQLGVRDLIVKPNTIDELGHVLAAVFEVTPTGASESR